MISATSIVMAIFLLGIDPNELMDDDSWKEYFKTYSAKWILLGLFVWMAYRYFPRNWMAPEGLSSWVRFQQRLGATMIFAFLGGYGGFFAYIHFFETLYATVSADCTRAPASALFRCEFVAYGEKRKLRSAVFSIENIQRIETLDDQSILLVTTDSKIIFPSGHMDEVSVRLSRLLQTEPNAQRARWEYILDKGQSSIKLSRRPASEPR